MSTRAERIAVLIDEYAAELIRANRTLDAQGQPEAAPDTAAHAAWEQRVLSTAEVLKRLIMGRADEELAAFDIGSAEGMGWPDVVR